MKTVIAFCALGIALLFFSHMAMSQNRMPCGPHDKFIKQLEQKYGEVLIGGGSVGSGSGLQLYIDPADGSFTIIFRQSPTVSCMAGVGKGWKFNRIKAPGRDM